jgi:hypothetical protein
VFFPIAFDEAVEFEPETAEVEFELSPIAMALEEASSPVTVARATESLPSAKLPAELDRPFAAENALGLIN